MPLIVYGDFEAWLEGICGLILPSGREPLSFALRADLLEYDAFSIKTFLTWVRANAVGLVHYLSPEFTSEGHAFELEDILDGEAFRRAWGEYDSPDDLADWAVRPTG